MIRHNLPTTGEKQLGFWLTFKLHVGKRQLSMSPYEFIFKVLFKTGTLSVLRIEVIVNSTICSLRLVYRQMNSLPPLLGERVGFQLNGIYVFLGMHLLQTREYFIISVMIKKKSNWVWINMMPNNLKSLLINFWTKLLSYNSWMLHNFCNDKEKVQLSMNNMMPNNLKSLLINFWTKLLSYKS